MEDQRIERIETQIEKLAESQSVAHAEIAKLAAGQHAIHESFGTISRALDQQAQRSQANWPVYLSAIAVIVIIGTLSLTPAYQAISKNAARLDDTYRHEMQQAEVRGEMNSGVAQLQHQVDALKIGNPSHLARIQGLERAVFNKAQPGAASK